MLQLVTSLLSIPSPTFHEAECSRFIHTWLINECPSVNIRQCGDSIIATRPDANSVDGPNIVLVGHIDTVPAFFTPYQNGNKLHGSGASDMKASVAQYMHLFRHFFTSSRLNLSLIVYTKEEGTPLETNGLYELIQVSPSFFKKIDLAIVGEPTNSAIQLGCVGSIHAKITVKGKACHSARPWQGQNALYKALPVVSYFSKLKPRKKTQFGVSFFDVLSITESHSEPGRTTIPGLWEANLNFRYAPRSMQEAEIELQSHFKKAGLALENTEILDHAYSGTVLETPLLKRVIKTLNQPIEAKQAWTDVAQLSQLGIPAFNFGAGLQEQAHKPDEYIHVDELIKYDNTLKACLDSI